MMTTVSRLAKIEDKIEQAARHLNPLMSCPGSYEDWKAVHDALNALSVARIQVEFLKEDLS